jgi:hypothetical protein
MLVLITDDVFKSAAIIKKAGAAASAASANSTSQNYLNILMSSYFRTNLICNLDANYLLNVDCARPPDYAASPASSKFGLNGENRADEEEEMAFHDYDEYNYDYLLRFKSFRIVARQVNSQISVNELINLYKHVRNVYFESNSTSGPSNVDGSAGGQANNLLHSMLVISNTHFISLFRLLFNDLNVKIQFVDIKKIAFISNNDMVCF